MYKVKQLKVAYTHSLEDVKNLAVRKMQVSSQLFASFRVARRSLDARKGKLSYVYSVYVTLLPGHSCLCRHADVEVFEEVVYTFPASRAAKQKRPVIVGSGPAGLLCALVLAEQGYAPIVFERGDCVDKRKHSIQNFWDNGVLNPESNMQFGEGGAGTFSDGKLNTGIKDHYGRMQKVLRTLVEAGAPESILVDSKPHIGTDYLEIVVKNLRRRIIDLGGEIHFNSCVTKLVHDGQKLLGVKVNNAREYDAEAVVLAVGHSARDSFALIHEAGVQMEAKTFAVGLRIEHCQKIINQQQYGKQGLLKGIPAADYKLAYKTNDGRGVYTFCMCPGGFVVNAASELGGCVSNGMSYYTRAGQNANSAVLINVYPQDFPSQDLFAGIRFQRNLEELAYRLGGGDYALPVQRLGDFLSGTIRQGFGDVSPAIKGHYAFADLSQLLPEALTQGLKEGLKAFDDKLKGFADADAVLSGVESRSSSPLRILRDESFQANITGLYPCGEGAGYAGGIMSAAVDGIKVAEAVAFSLYDQDDRRFLHGCSK